MKVFRVALPGYNAGTDTNPDHFSLLVNREGDYEDNALIKELARGGATIGINDSAPYEIIHNLGYIPFFLVFVLDVVTTPHRWMLVAHLQATASPPPYAAVADTTKIRIINWFGSTQFKWYVFYDKIAGGVNPAIIASDRGIRVAKSGFNALTDTNPNNYIFHSDLNTFKILKEGNATINYTGPGQYDFSHTLYLPNASSFLVFIKFPDGFTAVIPGTGLVYAKNSAYWAAGAAIDPTNIFIQLGGSSTPATMQIKYYIFETPLA